MGNPNGKKGAAFERVVADYLAHHVDDRIDRRVKTGAADRGDIANVRLHCTGARVVVEVKNVAQLNLAGWTTEANAERLNDNALAGVVVHKRRGVGDPALQYVSMTLDDLIALLTGARP